MKKVLAIEDSPRSQELIRIALEGTFQITFAASVKEAERYFFLHHPDLILLDLNLSGENGLEFFSSIASQRKSKQTPVIFLTANNDTAYKISAFKMGASDYVVKPFDPTELLLRVEARIQPSEKSEITYVSQNLYLDHHQCAAFSIIENDHIKVDLSSIEYRILCFFVECSAQVLSRDQILNKVWGPGTHYLDRTIDRHISSLKKKVPALKKFIKAVYGMGYIFQQDQSKDAA